MSLNFQLAQAKLRFNSLFLDNRRLTDERDGLDREHYRQDLGSGGGSGGQVLPPTVPPSNALEVGEVAAGCGDGGRGRRDQIIGHGEDHPPLLLSAVRTRTPVMTSSSAVRDRTVLLSTC